MDAAVGTRNATDGVSAAPAPPRVAANQQADARRTELILDALKTALADPRDHRLFQSGKLSGLFASRYGPPADAALAAIKDGLFETVRTEAKGKLIVEWVRVTPKGIGFVHDQDSPKAVLRDLRAAVGETRAGVPVWMADVRGELAAVAGRFEERVKELTAKLDDLTRRVEAAVRRTEAAGPRLPDPLARVVPWGVAALEYLDRREAAGGRGECPLAELFPAVRERHPQLTVAEFHDGLRRLHDNRAVRLTGAAAGAGHQPDPEFALIVGAELCHYAGR